MRHLYYDMQGNPIEMMEWAKSCAGDKRIVQQTPCGPFGFFWVSTVLLGLDHGFGEEGPPIIFETMVFSGFEFCWPFRKEALVFRRDREFVLWSWPLKFGTMTLTQRMARVIGWPWRKGSGFDEDRCATLAQAKSQHLDYVEKYSGWRGFKAMLRLLWNGNT